MNKSEFIREKSVELLAVFIAKDSLDSDTEFLVNKAINATEWLWEKLEEKGYCSELDVVASSDCAEDDCYINGNCDTP